MTKLRSFFGGAFASALALALAACSDGSDVTLVPASSTSSASTCAIAPGEDICRRHAELGDDGDALTFLQAAADFAGEARELAERTFALCDAIGSETHHYGVTIPEASPLEKKLANCAAVGKALDAYDPAYFQVHLAPPDCQPPTDFVCTSGPVFHTHVRGRCDPATVTSVPAPPDSADGKALSESFARHAPELAWLDKQRQELTDSLKLISGGTTTFGVKPNATPAACLQSAVKLVNAGSEDLKAAVDARARIGATTPRE